MINSKPALSISFGQRGALFSYRGNFIIRVKNKEKNTCKHNGNRLISSGFRYINLVSFCSNNDTISQNRHFAKRFNLLAKVILLGVSPYYLAKLKTFGEGICFFAKVLSYSEPMGVKSVYYVK